MSGETRRRRRLREELRAVLDAADGIPYALDSHTEDVIVALLARVEMRAARLDRQRRKARHERKARAALKPLREAHARAAGRLPHHIT